MNGIIAKSLRWNGSIIIEPHTFDLLKFFAPREGLRVSGVFTQLLPWVIYTHKTSCGRVFADCFDLRRSIRETRLRNELPITKTFRLADGLCLVASLIVEQFDGKEGWLLADGSVNVFLLDMGGQVLAVSVSCLDDSGEFFVDDWWLLLDRVGPLRTHDRVFSLTQSKNLATALPAQPLAGDFSAYASETQASEAIQADRRSIQRGVYRSCRLGGYSLQVYLRRHTVKRFRKVFTCKTIL
jgi:hypothetical protein